MNARHSTLRSRLLTGLIVALGIVVLALGIAIRVADLRFQTVLSGSMRPTLSPGDVAVTQGVPMSAIHVGDVIVFVPPTESQAVIHRITSLRERRHHHEGRRELGRGPLARHAGGLDRVPPGRRRALPGLAR